MTQRTLTIDKAVSIALQVIELHQEDARLLQEQIDYYRNGWRPVPVQNIDDAGYGLISALDAIKVLLNSAQTPVVTKPNPVPIG